MTLLGMGVLVFAIGSFVPNATGGILALISGLLVVFLFLFTTSTSAGGSGAEKRERKEEKEATRTGSCSTPTTIR